MKSSLTFKLERPDLPKNSIEDETFKVYCRQGKETIEIGVLDVIGQDEWGDGVDVDAAINTLRNNTSSPVRVRINSPGGLAYQGLALYNALATHDGYVETVVEGLAYSAASIIFMAGDKRIMYESSDFGIHRAHGLAMGNMNQMLAVAEFLETLDNHLIGIYSSGTGHSRDQVTTWLDGQTSGDMGTMFGAAEAVELGFADEMIPNKSRTTNESKLATVAASQQERIMPLALQSRRDMIRTMLADR